MNQTAPKRWLPENHKEALKEDGTRSDFFRWGQIWKKNTAGGREEISGGQNLTKKKKGLSEG